MWFTGRVAIGAVDHCVQLRHPSSLSYRPADARGRWELAKQRLTDQLALLLLSCQLHPTLPILSYPSDGRLSDLLGHSARLRPQYHYGLRPAHARELPTFTPEG